MVINSCGQLWPVNYFLLYVVSFQLVDYELLMYCVVTETDSKACH